MDKGPPGFVVYFDKLIKPGRIFNNTFGVPADQADEPGIRVTLPQASKCWCGHDDITDPVGAKDQYRIGLYARVLRGHCGLKSYPD